MPIRINLLAEAQALEDLRRRDPVKRALWVGAFLVFLMLAWSSSLQLQSLIAKGELNRLEAQLAAHTNEYQVVLENQRKLAEVNQKLNGLQTLTTNRLLYGTVLNALQQATIDDVQLTRFKSDQNYALAEGTPAKTNAAGRVTLAKPATVTERIVLTLDARDNSPNPGDQVHKFKQTLAECGYFQRALGATNEIRLTNLSPPQGSPDSKAFVSFTLECRYPEKTR
ncbi:MAG TPA: hypothetical protein VNT26_20165 [Candidatus Sulfotelmatobacter sp.]|nr:hypothetical protein [Candidatus Sulfotelmatobacter sp.]HWI56899.1 hypothetical protein [Bacillota bacterium]